MMPPTSSEDIELFLHGPTSMSSRFPRPVAIGLHPLSGGGPAVPARAAGSRRAGTRFDTVRFAKTGLSHNVRHAMNSESCLCFHTGLSTRRQRASACDDAVEAVLFELAWRRILSLRDPAGAPARGHPPWLPDPRLTDAPHRDCNVDEWPLIRQAPSSPTGFRRDVGCARRSPTRGTSELLKVAGRT